MTGVGVNFPEVNDAIGKYWQAEWGKPPYRIMDASQLVPHGPVDVVANGLDFAVFTGHKMWADPGIGILWGKKELLKSMEPCIGGGGAINFVHTDGYEVSGLPYRFEPGTPNLTGAVSLLTAVEYFESVGGYPEVAETERELVEYALEEFAERSETVTLVGPTVAVLPSGAIRAGVFSFTVEGKHVTDVADAFAAEDVCVRAGHHCAEPFHIRQEISGTVRMSISMYTTQDDLEKFFEVLDDIVRKPR